MGERMRRVIISLPCQMLENLDMISTQDGRKPAELMRVAIGTLVDAKMMQAQVLKNLESSFGRRKP